MQTKINSRRRARLVSAGIGVALGGALVGLGLVAASGAAPAHRLDIVNRVPKFMAFYKAASVKPMGEAARWALWQKLDGIAAVPPTPQGKASARRMLKAAWPKYPALLPKVPGLKAAAEKAAKVDFARLNTLFHAQDTPIHSRVLLYVGLYSYNAFTVPPMNGQPSTVVFPVEDPKPELVFAHELTHSLNAQLAGVKNGYGAPIGQVIFQEGLAMRADKALYPDYPDRTFVQMPGAKGWFARCTAHKDAIIKAIRPDLAKSGAAIVNKYVFGHGNTGMKREAYCAAWFVMGHMLKSGMTFPELARIPEGKMVTTVRKAIASM
jgi:hypothetical protein